MDDLFYLNIVYVEFNLPKDLRQNINVCESSIIKV